MTKEQAKSLKMTIERDGWKYVLLTQSMISDGWQLVAQRDYDLPRHVFVSAADYMEQRQAALNALLHRCMVET